MPGASAAPNGLNVSGRPLRNCFHGRPNGSKKIPDRRTEVSEFARAREENPRLGGFGVAAVIYAFQSVISYSDGHFFDAPRVRFAPTANDRNPRHTPIWTIANQIFQPSARAGRTAVRSATRSLPTQKCCKLCERRESESCNAATGQR